MDDGNPSLGRLPVLCDPAGVTHDLLQVRTPGVNFHVLKDADGLVLLDAGFIGARPLLARSLRRRGWEHLPIVGIVVTHGHLDHILNVAKLARETGAWIAAPRLDASHYLGQPDYRGWARVTGGLERIGRRALGFGAFVPDRWIDDGDRLEVWHGLQAVALPGHTLGQTGYFCEKLGLLFSADLFASYRRLVHYPPAIFNSEPGMMAASVARALALDPRGVVPNHGDASGPEVHLERLRKLARRCA